jgi:hypothetical protein
MKTKFVEYKEGEPRDCAKCCYRERVKIENLPCPKQGRFCAAGFRKDGKNGYFVEVKEEKQAAKKQASVKPPENKPTVHGMIGKFVVIEANSNADTFDVKESDVHGIFDTEKRAIDHICEQTRKDFEADNDSNIHVGEDWAGDCLIVEIKRVVRPVITAAVTCEIKDVE